MKLIIDDAHIDQIRKIYEYYPVDGVTTNPTILAKSGRQPYEVLREIREFIGDEAELHVQVTARAAEGMMEDAHRIIKELGKSTFVKIPSVPEGFKAMMALHGEGVKLTATAIYTPMQAFLAAKAGADYAAPYINRIDNMGYNGIKVARDIHDIFRNNGFKTEVLAASFKNSQQLLELCEYGVEASTVSPDVIFALVKNKAITSAIDDFIADFEGLVGAGKTMKDC
jgi:fructose-6-phosphate aldolase 2